MSFRVFFDFSTGLKFPILVPRGTYDRMMMCVANTEAALGIKREVYNGETRWNRWPLVKADITDEKLCNAVEEHNTTIRWFYNLLSKCRSTPADPGEELTPEIAADFWLGLEKLSVPPERWSKDYYRARMEAMYECLRGREAEGMSFDADPLTESQAASVIVMFSPWLDRGDIRLDVIKGEDCLSSSYYGEYEWCCQCGAVRPEDIDEDEEVCRECKESR